MPPRLSDPKNIRDLGDLMSDSGRFRQFLETPLLSLQDALRGVVAPERSLDWRGGIVQVLNMLRQIPAVDLQESKQDDLKILESVRDLCVRLLKLASMEQ